MVALFHVAQKQTLNWSVSFVSVSLKVLTNHLDVVEIEPPLPH